MGNCFVLREKKGADVKQLTSPMLVKDLLRCWGSVSLSKKSSKQHPSCSSAKTNRVSTNSGPAGQSFSSPTPGPGAKRRIKVVITKQQLQELLSKQKQQQQVSLGDLLSGFQSSNASSSSCTTNHDSAHCTPKLEPIPEENDDYF